MVERIEGMPAGTIGLRASGKLSPEDYREVLVPALREAVESGEVRMLFVLSDFDELEPGPGSRTRRPGFELGFREHSAWKRLAIVSDVEWVKKAFRMFAWMAPGEVEVFEPRSGGRGEDLGRRLELEPRGVAGRRSASCRPRSSRGAACAGRPGSSGAVSTAPSSPVSAGSSRARRT